MKNKIIVILGPTSSGKSDLAVEIAIKFGGEIISADSRQIYKGLNIGSGKITKKEMKHIPHHLLDVASPRRTFSVQQFQKKARRAIAEIIKRGNIPIIAGGTGQYIDSVVYDIPFSNVKPNPFLRKTLEKVSPEELFKQLEKIDPERAKTIDRHNPHRLIRALEIIDSIGKVPKQHPHAQHYPSLYETLFIGIDHSDDILKNRISERLNKRIRQGMISEVQNIRDSGVSWKRLESLGLEYRYVSKFLQNKISKNEMIQKLELEIWHFVKRQRTWWKRNPDIIWITGSTVKNESFNLVNKFLQ